MKWVQLSRALMVFTVLMTGSVSWGAGFATFSGKSLEGKPVSGKQLEGQTTVVIVTPDRDAGAQTRKWVEALRSGLSPSVRVRDIIAADVPFFISESDAIERARKKVPKKYWDQTWLSINSDIEKEIGVPEDTHDAYVFVVASDGSIISKVGGEPTEKKISEIKTTLRIATPVSP